MNACMRSAWARVAQISRISPSDSGSRSAAPAGVWGVWGGGGPASITLDPNGSPRVLGTVFARLVELASERRHVKRGSLHVRHDAVAVVAVRMRGLQLGDARLDARDGGLDLGMGLERAEHPRVVGDPHGPQLHHPQPAEVVDVH